MEHWYLRSRDPDQLDLFGDYQSNASPTVVCALRIAALFKVEMAAELERRRMTKAANLES